jgi:hypothetical protein
VPVRRNAAAKYERRLPVWAGDHQRVIRVVRAEQLRVGDIVHLHTNVGIERIELTAITRRTKGFKCTGHRVEDRSSWSFGVLFEQPVEIDE